jgi:hypothetical protein
VVDLRRGRGALASVPLRHEGSVEPAAGPSGPGAARASGPRGACCPPGTKGRVAARPDDVPGHHSDDGRRAAADRLGWGAARGARRSVPDQPSGVRSVRASCAAVREDDEAAAAPRRTFYQRMVVREVRRRARKVRGEPLSPEDWAAVIELNNTLAARAIKRVWRALPSSPRCGMCSAPFAGPGRFVVRPLGYRPSRKNPTLCARSLRRRGV